MTGLECDCNVEYSENELSLDIQSTDGKVDSKLKK